MNLIARNDLRQASTLVSLEEEKLMGLNYSRAARISTSKISLQTVEFESRKYMARLDYGAGVASQGRSIEGPSWAGTQRNPGLLHLQLVRARRIDGVRS